MVQTLAQGERVYRIGVNNLYQDGASTPAGILRHTEDEGFTVVRTNGGVDDSVCAAFTVPTEVLQELPFLVIETDAAASSGLSLDFVGQDTSLITCSTGKITGWTGRTVFHLGGLCRTGITCQLRCCGTEGQALSLTACYLTDSPCAVTFFGWDCADPLADDTPSDNVNSSVYGVDGLGMTAAGPWKTEDGFGYFYAYISQEQIGRTPYLVMKVNGEDISNLGHIFGLYAGDEFDLRLHSFAAGPQLQIVDLRTFGRAVRLRVTMTGDVRFTLLYLTQDLSTVIDRGAPGTPGFVAAADLTPVPGMDKNTVVKIGEYGVMYTPSDPVSDVNGASYYVLAGPTVRAYPYLVYQFGTASAVPSVFGVYGPDWEQNGTVLPAGDTERHVIDLRSLPAYRNGGEIRLQFRFDTETTFDELYLTAE